MIGASLFALGSFPAYAQLVGPGVVGSTFVAGSIFFTAAGYGQFRQALGPDRSGFHRWVGWRPRQRGWWAAAIQLVGTLLFNINTIRATAQGMSADETNRLVWTPDVFGSIAFLIASHLAWTITCGGLWAVRRGDRDWWVAALNYVGSIWFMVSAIAAFTVPTTDEPVNIALVNLATFLGAVGFLVGAYLLLPPVDDDTGGADDADGAMAT